MHVSFLFAALATGKTCHWRRSKIIGRHVVCRLIRSASYEAAVIKGLFPMFYVFNVLLVVLQILHIIWFTIILRLVHEFLTTGKVIECVVSVH